MRSTAIGNAGLNSARTSVQITQYQERDEGEIKGTEKKKSISNANKNARISGHFYESLAETVTAIKLSNTFQ
ncbi:hypothetical protein [Undibacterium curvum]|uniref:hypothetical protein n=1 Tax=Undibacterium curvum TaxID=2762294 RepID=UPI003D111DE3